MSQKIIIRPEAQNDIDSAFDWYEEQNTGLGREFTLEFSSSVDRIVENPQLYSELYRGIRRALVRSFPYGVYYHLNEKDIVVFAVLHLAMNPMKWKDRS